MGRSHRFAKPTGHFRSGTPSDWKGHHPWLSDDVHVYCDKSIKRYWRRKDRRTRKLELRDGCT